MTEAYSIDPMKGSSNSVVSAQWASRPADQKFLDLTSLHAQVTKWREASFTEDHKPGDMEVISKSDDATFVKLRIGETLFELNHFSFGQVASMANGAPASWLRRIPGQLAAVNLNYGLKSAEQKEKSIYLMQNGSTVLRGITSTKYGRIFDSEVVEAVMKIAGNGTGDTNWKVPGCIDWGSGHGIRYNPKVDISKENTTLYASDRDIFLFLVDDTHPIEVGKLDNGDPDLMFRGFYIWNSEVGDKTFGVATMYLRGVCQNRNLWGVEGFNEVTFRHTVTAPEKFLIEAAPALQTYSEGAAAKVIEGVTAAKSAVVAKTDEERVEFLAKFGFSEKQAKALIASAEVEEGHKPSNVWDFAQAVTAVARSRPHQEDRITMEKIAGKMLDKVTA